MSQYGGLKIFKSVSNNINNQGDVLTVYMPTQILYAIIDVANYNNPTMVVNFLENVIISKFDFPYNLYGLGFPKKKLQTACKITEAKKLFLAHESTGHYHENLVAYLENFGYSLSY